MKTLAEIVPVGRFRVFTEFHGVDPNRPSVILVNGALATTVSFRQTARFLREHFNVLLYDLPYAGQSREHNPDIGLLTSDDEVEVLRLMIERFRVQHVVSVSWGGVATLLTLARRPPSLRSAIVLSFSPIMNKPMRDYVHSARDLLEQRRYAEAAHLLNTTVGLYLPRLLKLYNYRYLIGLEEAETSQVHFHVRQICAMDTQSYLKQLENIDIPVLFVNGEKDEFTSAADVRVLNGHVPHCRFATVPAAGHFLELESRAASDHLRGLMLQFLRPPSSRESEFGLQSCPT